MRLTPADDPSPPPPAERTPIYWFARLTLALAEGDFAAASAAADGLRGLGYSLRIGPPAPTEKGGTDAR